jgi:hypothetical protein
MWAGIWNVPLASIGHTISIIIEEWSKSSHGKEFGPAWDFFPGLLVGFGWADYLVPSPDGIGICGATAALIAC